MFFYRRLFLNKRTRIKRTRIYRYRRPSNARAARPPHWHRISYDPFFVSRPLLHRYRTHFVLWYPIRSHTFKNRIRSPLAVNIGTEKSSVIGGCTHAFFSFNVLTS